MQDNTAKKILKKVVSDYDKIASEFDQTRQHNWQEFKSYLKHIKDGQKIVDLGCGNGRFLNFINQHRKVSYIGLEKSKKLLAAAKKLKGKFIHGDMLELPFKDKSQDVALAIASFHHIPTKKLKQKCLKEIHRILKKDGTFIVSVWNLFQPRYKKYIWISRLKSILSLGRYAPRDTLIPWGKSGVKRYYYAFKEKELQKLLEQSGFKVVQKNLGNNIVMICKKIK